MIIINVNSVLSRKKLNEVKRADILCKHCKAFFSCKKCKYYKRLSNVFRAGDCDHIYFLTHNYLVFNDYVYEITDEEKHIIIQLDKYCYGRKCAGCRYNCKTIRNKSGIKISTSISCSVTRIIAHRIIHGIITKDQYEIKK